MFRTCSFARMASFMPGLLLVGCLFHCGGEVQADDQLSVEVRETAGIARFGYPVTGEFIWPGDTEPGGFRLLAEGRPIAAQFSRHGEAGQGGAWEVDFNLDLQPLETKSFRIEPTVEQPAEGSGPQSLKLERSGGVIRIIRPGLEFETPGDASGLLLAVRAPHEDYLAGGSNGLTWRDRKGNTHRPGEVATSEKPKFEVIKSGPLCAALEFVSRQAPAAGGVKSTVRLDFPRSKSWVRVDWRLSDPDDSVTQIDAEFNLRLAPPSKRPTLVDFGATSYVYATLRTDEMAAFSAWPHAEQRGDNGQPAGHRLWEVRRGAAKKLVPYVVATADEDRPSEGWAHVMDDKVCTAIAVDRFARETPDRIEIAAEGRMRISREYAAQTESRASGRKRLVFWLHFVPSPPHIGAVTSPQSMQTPPQVRIVAK